MGNEVLIIQWLGTHWTSQFNSVNVIMSRCWRKLWPFDDEQAVIPFVAICIVACRRRVNAGLNFSFSSARSFLWHLENWALSLYRSLAKHLHYISNVKTTKPLGSRASDSRSRAEMASMVNTGSAEQGYKTCPRHSLRLPGVLSASQSKQHLS